MSETEKPVVAVEAPSDAKLQAAFDKIVPAGAAEKPAAKSEVAKAEAKEEQDAPETPETPDAEADPELDRAWAALERDGWRKSEIKKLGVETIKAMGSKRARHQEEVDHAYEDLKTYRTKTKAEKPAAQDTDSVDAEDDLSGALKQFEADFGPEAAKALRAVTKKVESLERTTQERTISEAQREAARIRGKVSEVYSEAKNDVAWNAVLSAAQSIAEKEDLPDAEAAVGRALEAIYGKRDGKPAKPLKAERLGDLPEAPNRKTKPVPVSKAERERAAFEAVIDGKGRDVAAKIYAGE